MVLAEEKIKKASLARSLFDAQVWVFWRYWNESIVKPSSAIESRNMRPKKTLEELSASLAFKKGKDCNVLTEYPKWSSPHSSSGYLTWYSWQVWRICCCQTCLRVEIGLNVTGEELSSKGAGSDLKNSDSTSHYRASKRLSANLSFTYLTSSFPPGRPWMPQLPKMSLPSHAT